MLLRIGDAVFMVCIELRGLDIGVAQHLLHLVKLSSVLKPRVAGSPRDQTRLATCTMHTHATSDAIP